MNFLLLALQASLTCLLAQASSVTPVEIPIQKPVPVDILNVFPKVVGGGTAFPNEFPFMVHLNTIWTREDGAMCGASIINSDFVLTAGHCVYHPKHGFANPENITMYLGKYGIGLSSPSAQVVHGSQIYHAGYEPNKYMNDIAIVRVAQKIHLQTGILQPICLASGTKTYADQWGLIIGWGVNKYGYYRGSNNGVEPTHPQNLQKAQMYILSSFECSRLSVNNGYNHATPDKICIYDAQNAKKGMCSGDSGGPLVVFENGHYVQVGVASYISAACGYQSPGVYTRVTNFRSLIQRVVGVGNYLAC